VLDPTARKPRGKLPEERRDLLHQARDSYREVLALAPDAHLARLRLGRVLWRLGRMDEARSALELVTARRHDSEARVSYLAHLFLGQVEEDEGRLREAVDHYRKALDADPAAHTAGVALSHALLLLGDRVGARDTLERALRASSHRSGDAFWSYRAGEYKKAPAILDELRQEAVR
jgi:tetratricopeptide (TPR) repeat protein